VKKSFIWAFGLIALVNLLALAWLFFTSLPWWLISEIKLENSAYLPPQLILAKVDYIKGTSIWQVDKTKLQKDLKDLPWLKGFTLHKIYPRALSISLNCRVPYFLIDTKKHQWILDQEKVILNRDGVTINNYPLFKVTGVESLAELETFLAEVLPLTKELIKYFSPDQIILNYSSTGDLTINLKSGQLIKLGRSEHSKEKIEVLVQLRRALDQNWSKVEYIDLRAYQTPAVKLRKR
jgi:cell division septal protein FtsQ